VRREQQPPVARVHDHYFGVDTGDGPVFPAGRTKLIVVHILLVLV